MRDFFEYAFVLEDIIEMNIQGYWYEVKIKVDMSSKSKQLF